MATPEDIERKLICSICLNVLREPKLLTCGHTYCLACLHSHICHAHTPRTVGDVLGFSCPVCRDFVPAPDSTSPQLAWAALYKTNYIVQDLLEVHRDNKRTRPPCPAHSGKALELFCRDCNLPLCDRCVSLQHRACSQVVELTTVVKEKRNVTGQQLLHVNSMMSQCDGKRKRCETGKGELDRIEQEVAEKIDRECLDVIEKVTSHVLRESDRLKREVRGQCEMGRAMVRSYVSKCQELGAVLSRMRTYLAKKTCEVTISAPPNLDEEARVANTLSKLSRAVSAIDNPCHFEVGLSLDDSALTQALADLHLGEVFTLQISDTVQEVEAANEVLELDENAVTHSTPQTSRSSASASETPPGLPRTAVASRRHGQTPGGIVILDPSTSGNQSPYSQTRDKLITRSAVATASTSTSTQSSSSKRNVVATPSPPLQIRGVNKTSPQRGTSSTQTLVSKPRTTPSSTTSRPTQDRDREFEDIFTTTSSANRQTIVAMTTATAAVGAVGATAVTRKKNSHNTCPHPGGPSSSVCGDVIYVTEHPLCGNPLRETYASQDDDDYNDDDDDNYNEDENDDQIRGDNGHRSNDDVSIGKEG